MLTICLTHDVDRVRKGHQYLTHALRRGRVGRLRTLFSGPDPYWNFEKIMKLEDKYGVLSSWYFLEESIPFMPLKPATWKLSLGRYSVKEKAIRQVMRQLDADGWEIGVHGSYRSYRSLELLQQEKAIVEDALGRSVRGIRQHYLNLDVPETWKLQKQAGFDYDASFGYRRGLGWRQDRLQPFVDPDSSMRVVPLAIMECNLFSEANGDSERALATARDLMDQAEQRNALLSLLWHPHVFSDPDFPGYGWVYEQVIAEGRERGAEFLTAGEAANRLEPVEIRQ